MKLNYLPLFIILYLFPAVSVADPIDKIAQLVRQGNIHELSKLFAANVDITVPGDENVYTKAQAEPILNKFFDQNKPKSVKLLHKINSNPNYLFGVLIIDTGKGAFRIALTLKQTNGNLEVIEFRVEKEKVR